LARKPMNLLHSATQMQYGILNYIVIENITS